MDRDGDMIRGIVRDSSDRRLMKRNVFYLSICQALWMSANALLIAVSALIGLSLAPVQQLATLPLGLQFLAGTAVALPASLLMRRVGRRTGFVIGLSIGMAGALGCLAAMLAGSFAGFCAGSALIGACNGFAQYYRFAAADVATDEFRSRAISLVLAGGVLAALIGPNLANLSKSWVPSVTFAGGFLCIAFLYVVSIGVLFLARMPQPQSVSSRETGRPLANIVRQPAFVIAVCGGIVGYGVMNLLMTATPLAMHGYGHLFADTAFVIQWHLIGMFAPSFFTGHLIKRFGVTDVMAAGALLLLSCVAMNLAGKSVMHFWGALFLLGVGWNFLFIGATTLLTEIHSVPEKAKTQGVNDVIVFGVVAMTAMSSGWLHHRYGWTVINWTVIAPVILILFATLWLRIQRVRRAFA
ncbi:MAG: MFS transporter [Gammaproteobacteria bacterium]|nr:MFS transporter [Gammaproteobacteria bacterium]